jgi:hypothetical protein
MATLSCTTTAEGKNTYACTGGTAGGCARAIAKLKTVDTAGSAPVPELGELRVVDADTGPGDTVRVGLRTFSVATHDIIIHELDGGEAMVVVFEGDRLIFRGRRPQSLIKYVPEDKSGSLPFREALEREDSLRIDLQDLKARFAI